VAAVFSPESVNRVTGPQQQTTAPEPGVSLDGRVIRVIDGDTVEVETRLVHRIRMADCWCKEIRLGRNTTEADKAQGLVARLYLAGLLDACDHNVRIHIPGNGGNLSALTTLGRIVGRIWRRGRDGVVEPVDLSAKMVAAGHATATKPTD
jgi:endonuclease YncB( thermonuclease family)